MSISITERLRLLMQQRVYQTPTIRDALAEIERLQAEIARLTAKAAYFEHDSECCRGCTECSRLYVAWKLMEECTEAEIYQEAIDEAVRKSTLRCPGGDYCECCRPGCDCGCRNDCPAFRNLIRELMKSREGELPT